MTLWYLARSLGFVAVVALSASVSLGALATIERDAPHARENRLVRQLVHRSVALVGLGALVLHVVAIVLDSSVDVPLAAVVVPFVSGFAPFAVGLGTLALLAFGVAAGSGAARGRLAPSAGAARAWRGVHATAYAAWALCMLHGLLAGTDTGATWALLTYAACGALVLVSLGARWLLATPRRVETREGSRRLTTSAVQR